MNQSNNFYFHTNAVRSDLGFNFYGLFYVKTNEILITKNLGKIKEKTPSNLLPKFYISSLRKMLLSPKEKLISWISKYGKSLFL